MMSSAADSRVGQFRSSVQWFLEGNTPSYKVEQIVDLMVSLRMLAIKLREPKNSESAEKVGLEQLAKKLQTFTRKELEDTDTLKRLAISLKDVVRGTPHSADNKEFRDAVVQLIIIAEGHLDLPFRKLVIELADSL